MINRQQYEDAMNVIRTYRREQKDLHDVHTRSRKRTVVYKRIIIAKKMRDRGYRLQDIAITLGIKTHSSIIYYLKRYDELKRYPDFKELIKEAELS